MSQNSEISQGSMHAKVSDASTRIAQKRIDDAAPALVLPGGKMVNPWLVLISIMLGFFMSLLDATITNIALTTIQGSLHTTLSTVSWIINAYLIAFASLLITMGRFADQFGRKRIFMIGMIIFSIGSLLCAVAPNIEALIVFRIVQGVGAAALNSVSLAIITGVFPAQKRGAAVGIWGALTGLAAAVGPVLGGFLLSLSTAYIGGIQLDSWRWIFFINIPLCIAGLLLVARNVPEMRDLDASNKIDFWGLLTLSVGMVCLALALIQGNDWGWDARILGLFAAALAACALFLVIEARQQQPILDLRLFSIRSFSAANIVMFLFSVAAQGAFLLVILYFIDARGTSQLNAAYAFLPVPLAAFVVSAFASPLSRKISPKYFTIAGMLIFGLGFLAFSTVNAGTSFLSTVLWGIVLGAGLGLCYSSLPAMVLAEIPPAKLGVASGAFNTFRQFGFAIGVALLIGLFSGHVASRGQEAQSTAIISAFALCWLVCGVIALVGILPAFFTVGPRSDVKSGRATR